MKDVELTLRAAAQAYRSVRALSIDAGVPYATAHGFVVGERGITIGTAAKLARTLGLELRAAAPRRKG